MVKTGIVPLAWGGLLLVSLLLIGLVVWGLWSGPVYSSDTTRLFEENFLYRAEHYQRLKLGVGILRNLLTWGILLAAGIFSYKILVVLSPPPVCKVILAVLLLFLVLKLFLFPLEYYSGFLLEKEFGLASPHFLSWLGDYLKSTVLYLGVGVLLFSGLYYLTVYFPSRWWWMAGILFALFTVLSSFLYPVLIAPMFYRFEPLQEEGLKEDIKDMAERAGIEVEEVLVADASRRTARANAFFAGLGSSQRIVLYDNLVEGFSEEEVKVVVAHEMAHWKHSHVVKGLVAGALAGLLALYLLYKLLGSMGLTGDLRMLPWALLFFSLVSFLSQPLQNSLSREWERQSDREALHLTGTPAAQADLKINLAQANLSQVEPHSAVRAIYYSHPPLIERIRMAREYGQEERP